MHKKMFIIYNIQLQMLTLLYLTKDMRHGIMIKLSHGARVDGERGKVEQIGRSKFWRTCSKRIHLTKVLRCDRMKKLTVLDELLGKSRKMRAELKFTNCLLDKNDRM